MVVDGERQRQCQAVSIVYSAYSSEKISSKSLNSFAECRCFVLNVVSLVSVLILCQVLATSREAL